MNEYSLVACSPLKCGSPGSLPTWVFDSLCVAVESFISINQINKNGANNTKTNLAARVNGCIGRDEIRNKNKLLNCILRNKSIRAL